MMKSGVARHIILAVLSCVALVANAQSDRQFIREGNRLFDKQQYDKAEIQYRKAISKNPSNPQAIYNLGCALMMQNKDSAAVTQYEKAAKVETNKLRLASVYHNIGVICQNHRMYGEAIKAYEQSLRNNPKDNETRYNLALCKKLLKNDNKKKDKDSNKQQKDDKSKDKKKDNDKNEKEKNKQQQPQEQMSRENAEQLLNAAIQNEKATQQRMKKAMQKPGSRKSSEKNW